RPHPALSCGRGRSDRYPRPRDAELYVRPPHRRRRSGRAVSANPRRRGRKPGRCPMKCDLMGKVSLVTGAARGIGQAIADRLAANGSRVIYTDLDRAATEAAAFRSAGAKGLRMDVTRADEIEAVIGNVIAECGRLDILVNNAGVNTLAHRVTIDQFPREEWDRILSVDLTGLYEVSRFAARVMRKQGAGRIINIASIVGLVPLRLQCAFVAAKAGVVNLTR